MSKDPEITVHFYITYILLTTLHAHVFRIIRYPENLLRDLIFKNSKANTGKVEVHFTKLSV